MLPQKITAHVKQLMRAAKKSDTQSYNALCKQFIATEKELEVSENETDDPLGEQKHSVLPRLIHQYKNRVLLLSTSSCIGYCRYCFRRSFTSVENGFMSEWELDKVCTYLKNHTEVEEILVSGGDVLSASDDKVFELLQKLRAVNETLLLRICTRANVFMPQRFTKKLVAFFKSMRPLWLIPHINHPAELDGQTKKSLIKLIDSGIPVQSQTVLLRGVNDSVPVLKKLFTGLVQIGVKPGYLFHTDMAKGTAHFRMSKEEGLQLYKALRIELSGLSLPVYAVDLPNGGGKLNMLEWGKKT